MNQKPLYSIMFAMAVGFAAMSGAANAEFELVSEQTPASQIPITQTTITPHAWLGLASLASVYQSMKRELNNDTIEDSFNLKAQVLDELTKGDVFAVIPYPYELLAESLTVPEQVCHAIVLHVNVKGCVVENSNPQQPLVDVYFGRKEYQHPQKALKVQYEFSVGERHDNYTLVSMTADKGPLKTENIAIHIEFLPIDKDLSFIHFAYSANYGDLARFALNTYLATLGRKKVGFSEIGTDKQGEPVYIKGIQGVVERNTMRYFFALHSYFSTYYQPESQRFAASLNRWFDYVEKYPKQLYELPREEYLKAKHKERRDVDKILSASKES
jgi:hypothetical protein